MRFNVINLTSLKLLLIMKACFHHRMNNKKVIKIIIKKSDVRCKLTIVILKVEIIF